MIVVLAPIGAATTMGISILILISINPAIISNLSMALLRTVRQEVHTQILNPAITLVVATAARLLALLVHLVITPRKPWPSSTSSKRFQASAADFHNYQAYRQVCHSFIARRWQRLPIEQTSSSSYSLFPATHLPFFLALHLLSGSGTIRFLCTCTNIIPTLLYDCLRKREFGPGSKSKLDEMKENGWRSAL
jgi:hypothetical protein